MTLQSEFIRNSVKTIRFFFTIGGGAYGSAGDRTSILTGHSARPCPRRACGLGRRRPRRLAPAPLTIGSGFPPAGPAPEATLLAMPPSGGAARLHSLANAFECGTWAASTPEDPETRRPR